jgi:hypothetical protein
MNKFEEAVANSVDITELYGDRQAIIEYLITDKPPKGYKLRGRKIESDSRLMK